MKIVGYLSALSKYFSIGDGGWAFDGIEMTSVTENDDGQMVVNCMSTHLTSFAVLVDVSGSLSVSSYNNKTVKPRLSEPLWSVPKI